MQAQKQSLFPTESPGEFNYASERLFELFSCFYLFYFFIIELFLNLFYSFYFEL